MINMWTLYPKNDLSIRCFFASRVLGNCKNKQRKGAELELNNYIVQAIGFVSTGLSLISFQQKSRKRILGFQMMASLTFSLHLILLGAVTGGVLDFISFIRTLIFSNNEKKWASSPLWMYAFLAFFIVSGIVTWSDWTSSLAIVATLMQTISLWMKKPFRIRIISLCSAPLWFAYNMINMSYSGMVMESIAATSIVISIIRNDLNFVRKTKNIEKNCE